MYLQYFLSYGSLLAGTLALACAGLACWRLSKVLHERSFAIAAWAMGGSVVLEAAYYTIYQFYGFFPPALAMRWASVSMTMYQVAWLCLLVFFVSFSVGAVRRSLLAKKAVEREPAP